MRLRAPAVVSPTALAAALVAVACGAEPALSDGLALVGEMGPEELEGRVRRVGSQPFSRTVIESDDGDATLVVGPFAPEIGRLAGARVRVTGHFEPGEVLGPTLAASSYEIVSVDGDRPIVGTLGSDEDGFFLKSRGQVFRLSVVSDRLAARSGVFLWVVLDGNEGVARYGILRDEP